MSYFSHNPEALDEICVLAIMDKLIKESGLVETENVSAAVLAGVIHVMADVLYYARIPKAPDTAVPSTVTEALMLWASEEMADQEQAFWDSFVP